MIPAEYYQPIFLFIVTIFTIIALQTYPQKRENIVSNDYRFTLCLALFIALFIGFRPNHIEFVDMLGYSYKYDNLYIYDLKPTWDTENIIFDNLLIYMSTIGLDKSIFFWTIASIYCVGTFVAVKKLFRNDVLIAYLVWLGAFSTFSYGVNGIKAGAAATLFLIAVAYYNKLKISALLLLFSLGFHHSMVMPIAAFILAYLYKNIKMYYCGWLFCLLMATLHISYFEMLFADLSNDKGAAYLASDGLDWGGQTGFRIDFVLYSAMPALVGYWAVFKRKIQSKRYEFMLAIYLTTNSIWMLCMYANFNNRIAYLSWFMYPVVLVYPFFCQDFGPDWNRQLSKVTSLHLLFTLFMEIIYY